MNKSLTILLIFAMMASCQSGPDKPEPQPYRFNREALDKLVRENKAIYDASKRSDGTLESETFYLPDTVKYRVIYDERSNIAQVFKFDVHGQAVWMEYYHDNGQRQAHYELKAFQELGPQSVFHGRFTTWYPNAMRESEGEYSKKDMRWILEYDKEGYPGDTTFYEYTGKKPVIAEDSVAQTDSAPAPKVEKINTATTPQ